MVVATMDTEHYQFMALGHDRAEAEDALRRGWLKHIDREPAANQWSATGELKSWDDVVEYYGPWFTEISTGMCKLLGTDRILVDRPTGKQG